MIAKEIIFLVEVRLPLFLGRKPRHGRRVAGASGVDEEVPRPAQRWDHGQM